MSSQGTSRNPSSRSCAMSHARDATAQEMPRRRHPSSDSRSARRRRTVGSEPGPTHRRLLLRAALLSAALGSVAQEAAPGGGSGGDLPGLEKVRADVARGFEWKEKTGGEEGVDLPRRLSDVTGYIVGGENVTDDGDGMRRYPWMCSLTRDGDHFCGGALIAPDIIVTAAHCQSVDGVKVGLVNRHSVSEPTFNNIGKFIHPSYDIGYVNDIMIVKLPGRVNAEAYPPVSVNSKSQTPSPGDELITMGWGITAVGSESMPTNLREVSLFHVRQKACKNAHGKFRVKPDMLCASDAGQDACRGDSGGPLITATPPHELVGVASWGNGCASAAYPGVYSRTSYNYDWIRSQICDLSAAPPAYFNCSSTPSPTPQPVELTLEVFKPTLQPVEWAEPIPTTEPIEQGIDPTLAPVSNPTSEPTTLKPTLGPEPMPSQFDTPRPITAFPTPDGMDMGTTLVPSTAPQSDAVVHGVDGGLVGSLDEVSNVDEIITKPPSESSNDVLEPREPSSSFPTSGAKTVAGIKLAALAAAVAPVICSLME